MIIGLTGGSGTGKSSASQIFEKNGFIIIDFDKISRSVCEKGSQCLKELVCTFGDAILDENNALNRRKLGEIVFSDKEKLSKLNKITHKHILDESERITAKYKNKNIIYDAPLLFEARLEEKCRYVISVLADKQKRIDRICKRDGISAEVARRRIESQHDDEFYIEKSDFCVYNNDDIESLNIQIENIIRRISDG